MSLYATVAAMAAAGCSADQIAAVVKAEEEARADAERARREARREGNLRRQQAKRERDAALVESARNDSNAVTDVTEGNARNAVTSRDEALQSVTGVPLEVSPKDNNQTPILDPSPVCETGAKRFALTGSELARKADEFYAAYPKKVDPKDAKARFIRLAKSGIDPDHMIAAARAYAEAHSAAGTVKQFIPAPAVWLNRGGYDSEDLPQPRAGPALNGRAPPRPSPLSTRMQALSDLFDEYSREPDQITDNPSWPDASSSGGRVVGRIGGPR